MIFEGLNEKFQNIFSQLKRKGKLSEKDIQEVNREIKMALLEADVNFKVVKKFTKNIGERAIGQEVLSSLTPGQQFIKIVKDEMTTLLGGEIETLADKAKAASPACHVTASAPPFLIVQGSKDPLVP
ncbi:MAG: signal recognition particle receptor subunit alpha, partial [Acetobacterium sp.]|nr:signal recognition particle receptor subunit alpha [Acetobacterium sp.]